MIMDILILHIIASSPPPSLFNFASSEWGNEIMKLVREARIGSFPLANLAAFYNKPHLIDVLDYLGVFIGREKENNEVERIRKTFEYYYYDPHLEKENVTEYLAKTKYFGFNSDGGYPIEQAVENGHVEVAKELMKRRVYVGVKYAGDSNSNNDYFSLLEIAVKRDFLDIVKVLVPKEELESQRDRLHDYACSYGSDKVEEWLNNER